MTDISVVIAARNAAGELGDQLGALADQSFGGRWEIVVADNGSTDGTLEVCRRFSQTDSAGRLRVVDASGPARKSYAANCGARVAMGKALLFLDADDMVAPGYLDAMHEALQGSSAASARFEVDRLNEGWVRASRHVPRDTLSCSSYNFLPVAPGGGIGVRRPIFWELGGFDERLPRCEDVAFFWRLQLAGFDLRSVPNAVVHVRFRASLVSIFRQGMGYGASAPLLYRLHRAHGMPRRSSFSAARFHASLFSCVAGIRSKGDLGGCAFLAGVRVGLVRGSIANRVVYL